MLGAHTPMYRLLYDYLPGVNLFRRPSDAAFLLNFCLAMLTGFSASSLIASGRRAAIAIPGVATVWFVIIAATEASKGLPYRIILLLAGASSALLLAAWWLPARWRNGVLASGLVVLCLGDFRVFNLPNQLNGHGMGPARYLESGGPALQAIKRDSASASGLPFRTEPTIAGEFASTALVIHGIDSTQGYNPLRVRLYADVFGAQETGNDARAFTAALPARDSALFDLSGTRFVLTSEDAPHEEFVHVLSEGKLNLWRNERAYERILTPTDARVLPAGTRPGAAQFEGVDFNRELLLYPASSTDEADARAAAAQCRGRASIADVAFGNSYVAFNVSAAAPSWVTISDLDFPGWRAYVDDNRTRIWRANGLYRAVCVPAGSHRVAFRFNPATFLADAIFRSR
jgi:hypothetical protein